MFLPFARGGEVGLANAEVIKSSVLNNIVREYHLNFDTIWELNLAIEDNEIIFDMT
jgi:hypothetical protein